jgi:rubredoxin
MHECLECGYVYVPADGVPSAGVSPGTDFEDVPEGFSCPACGAAAASFAPVSRRS